MKDSYIFCSIYKTPFMSWTRTQATNQLHCWKLIDAEFPIELKYNKQVQSIRILADDQRLFFIERTGFLQHKLLLRTEYSVVTSEIHPAKNWHSGIVIFEGKKYHYLLQGNLLSLSLRKENASSGFEIDEVLSLDQFEFSALLFGTLRLLTKPHKRKAESVLT
jgi:hypothetical protein